VAGAWSAVALGELATAMAAAGVRQWRFAPRPRGIAHVAVIVVSASLVLAGLPLLAQRSLGGPVVVVTAMVVVLAVARVPGRRIGTERVAPTAEVDA
jgi:hypothetical protein